MSNHFQFGRRTYGRMLLLSVIGGLIVWQSGCARALRPDANKVAKAGSLTARQMGDFYDSLAKDNLRTWELFSFENAYDTAIILAKRKDEDRLQPQPPPPTEKERRAKADGKARVEREDIFKDYQARHQALVARKQLANEVQNLYDSFARLADYDAPGEVLKRVDQLEGTIGAVISNPFPKAQTDLVNGILKDVITHLRTVKQNKLILRGNRDIIAVLQKLSEFYDAEKIVYKSIPTSRAAFTVNVAKKLVTKKEVISTSLVEDVLANYGLKWPDPQHPFTDETLIEGIKGLIDARAKPLEMISQDAADKLAITIGKLIDLHKQLEAKPQTLSFEEFAESSATVQVLLTQLKEKGVPADALLDVLKTILKEK